MAETILRPKRARLTVALACVAETSPRVWAGVETLRADPSGFVATFAGGLRKMHVNWQITDPREAWEALAARGVIPQDWIEDPRRAFPCERCEGLGGREFRDPDSGELSWLVCSTCATDCAACDGTGEDADATGGACPKCVGGRVGRGTLPHPPSVAACVALAADAPGVLAAEALARDSAKHEAIVWRVVPAGEVTRGTAPAYNHTRGDSALTPCARCAARRDVLALGYSLDVPDYDDERRDAVTLLCPELS